MRRGVFGLLATTLAVIFISGLDDAGVLLSWGVALGALGVRALLGAMRTPLS
jgi:hypothetical protein